MIASTDVDGCSIAYEVLGQGVPVVLTPGGRNPMEMARPLAEKLAASFRVILWDRANIGRSDVEFKGARDLDLWSDQLAGLLGRLGTGPAYLCGGSAGSRVSYTTARRYPELVRGIYLWLVSAGPVGEQLRESYYGTFAAMARQGGMAAVAADSYWAARIEANPANKGRLLSQDPSHFADVMRRWADGIRPEDPVFGATADDLRAITAPTGILAAAAGDHGHPREASVRAAELIPGAELIDSDAFQAEWPGLQQQALANYEQARTLPGLITDWLLSTEKRLSA
ncbi:MAG: alpha/beta hydrolase [Acidimicrobiaceae bacterium]|nr:alpha/beta hydrolase [Acidimicrobiaceae bacterium]